ncbi:MAG: hypothetical protein IPJ55_13240 [Chloracidobacterium sp.]|nr:hypothetical protein [Chloracidobacterium sp.]
MKNILIIDNSEYLTGANKSIAKFAKALGGSCKFHWAVTKAISQDDLAEIVENDIVVDLGLLRFRQNCLRACFIFHA